MVNHTTNGNKTNNYHTTNGNKTNNNHTTNGNKTNNHFSSQIINTKKTTTCMSKWRRVLLQLINWMIKFGEMGGLVYGV